jgi:adenylate cyclase class 2
MFEVEVKARVKNLEKLKSKLEAMGCVFSKEIEQEDRIFTDSDEDFAAYQPGVNFLRIREQGDKVLFTLKRSRSNELDSIEHEITVNDADELKNIIQSLGYHEAARVNKRRQQTKYKEYQISLDEVEGLGKFIEVEQFTDEESKQAQEQLFKFLESLGVFRNDRVTRGYDTLVYLKEQNRTDST